VDSIGLPVFVFWHFVISLALITLVLMHSGRDTGMGGMGYVPASQGGTHIVERNLTRLTIVVGTIFFTNTVVLYHLLQ
jgi:preprotein translocase subunit SecG